jgi:hypothetical protein
MMGSGRHIAAPYRLSEPGHAMCVMGITFPAIVRVYLQAYLIIIITQAIQTLRVGIVSLSSAMGKRFL